MNTDYSNFYHLLASNEGLALTPYRDSKNTISIGYGRNLTLRGITEREAAYLLANDVKDYLARIPSVLPWFSSLGEVRQAVLVDMCHNLGLRGLLAFRKMLSALAKGDSEEAAREMLDSLWAKQVGNRATRLAEMMRSNEWPEGFND